MEFFSAYSMAQSILDIFFDGLFKNQPTIVFLFWALGIGAALWIPLFVLQGVALYTMAKGQGIKRKWMAFVPFFNILCLGKIAGECRFFNRKMKNAGIYALIAQIFATVASALMLASQMYLYFVYGEPTPVTEVLYGVEITYNTWPAATAGLGKMASWYYEHGNDFVSIFGLIYDILMIVLVIATLKKYNPKHYLGLSILSLFVPLSRHIILFVLRGRKPIDYEAMMRARREAYIRQQQQYYQQYGNPYGNPYGRPYGGGYGNPYGNPHSNPYGAPGQNQQTPPPAEDPFEEFSSKPSDSANSDSKGNETDDTDGFFD